MVLGIDQYLGIGGKLQALGCQLPGCTGRNALDEIKRYYRDENLTADLERELARERADATSNLERSLYAARSYFAA